MTPELWERVKDLFEQLSDSDAEQRQKILSTLDPEVRSEVEQLLSQYDDTDSLPVEQAVGPAQEILAAILGNFHTFETGEVLQNRFEIKAFLGSGGMGEVYEALDRKLGAIAIKTVRFDLLSDASVVERFRREVQRARLVSHVNVCRVNEWFDQTTTSGQVVPFATMELLTGPTLYAAVKDNGPFSEAEAQAIAAQLCAGLSAAHDADVIHRDFKSGNIILTRRRDGSVRAVITDFGLARLITGGGVQTSIASQVAGTKAYLAPELLHGERASRASDIFALGVVLFRLATGHYPFDPEADLETALALRKRAPNVRDFVSSLSAGWTRAVSDCLEFEASRRPSSAAEVAAILSGASRGNNTPPSHIARRYLLTVGAVAGLGTIGSELWRRRPAGPFTAATDEIKALVEEFDSSDPSGALGRSVRNLFRLILAGSGKVVPLRHDDVRNALDAAGIGALPLKGTAARAVAQRAGAKVLIGGEIRSKDEGYSLFTRITDAESGRELRSHRQTIRESANLPSGVELAAVELQLLSNSGVATAQMGRSPLEQADTVVPDALEKFTVGLDYYYAGESQVAQAYMQEAVRLDPNFAIAHVYDATIFCAFRRDDLAMGPASRAYALREKVNPRHRHHAEALYYIVHGDIGKAHDQFRILAGLYPQEAQLQRHLAQSYAQFERSEPELEHARRAVELDPVNALNQNLYIGALADNGRFDEAANAVAKAESLLPNKPTILYAKSYVCLLRSDIETAVQYSRKVSSSRDLEGLARQLELKALILGGRLNEARQRMELDLGVRRVGGDQSSVDAYHYWLGQIRSLDRDTAGVTECASALSRGEALPPNLTVLRHAAELAWRARALDLLQTVVTKMQRIAGVHDSTRAQGILHYAMGLHADASGARDAAGLIDKAHAFWPDVTNCAALGDVLEREGRHSEALPWLQKVAAAKAWALRSDAVFLWVRSLALGAEVAVRLGKTTDAATLAQTFGQHWGTQYASESVRRLLKSSGD